MLAIDRNQVDVLVQYLSDTFIHLITWLFLSLYLSPCIPLSYKARGKIDKKKGGEAPLLKNYFPFPR